MSKKRIAVLVSGGGTNLQVLIDAQKSGVIQNGEIVLVISSKQGVFALERAEKVGIETLVLERANFTDSKSYSKALLDILNENNLDLIVLAGFMCILDESVPNAFVDRIINIHPSLIPSFCGEGMYGLNVHKAVLEYGVKVTGATVHFVNEIVDGGRIILQKAVDVHENDTPEILQKRVMEQAEWVILPQAVELVCKNLSKTNINEMTDSEIYDKFIRNSDFSDVELVGKTCLDCVIDEIAEIDINDEQ